MKKYLRDNYSMPASADVTTRPGDMAAGFVVSGTLIVFLVYLLVAMIDSVDLVALVEFLSSVLP